MLDTESFLIGIAAGAGGGGGGDNPNHVETISAPLSDLFNDLDFDVLVSAVSNRNVTLQLEFQGALLVGQYLSGGLLFSACLFDSPTDTSLYNAGAAYYNNVGGLVYAKTLFGSNFVDVPASTAVTLTIIYHPLP